MSAMAATYNMALYQAATFVKQLRWLDSEGKPIDLTGCWVTLVSQTISMYV